MWKVVNDITNSNSETNWNLKEGDKIITAESEVANIFNHYFIDKLYNLKEGKDKSKIKDPEELLKKDLKKKQLHFELKE